MVESSNIPIQAMAEKMPIRAYNVFAKPILSSMGIYTNNNLTIEKLNE